MPKKTAVCLDRIFFSYEKTLILENATLSIDQGDFVGIFGPNGGGKTTFLKLLLGFLKPDSGKIQILGQNVEKNRPRIGYVPQITKLDKQFPITVEEVVQMGCLSQTTLFGTLRPESKEIALQALEQVGMIHLKNRSFGTLSGGQAQRVLIARALASKPKILILDEPTASVDPEAEEEIIKLLSSLKGTMTLLMVTHDLETILRQVEKLVCIHRHVNLLSPSEVCEHIGLGLYHSPLIKKHFNSR